MGKDREPVDQQHHPPPATSPAPSQHPRDPKLQAARVRLPDGVYKEFEVNRGSEGEALFRQVTSDLSIEEREYFSLCFYDKEEGIRHWLYNDKKILKQLKNLPWEFSFEVKFYPTTPTTIVDDHARYYVFLQLRRDILTGRLPATADTHALLGSFVAQIEFGDAPAQVNDEYEKFIVGARLVPTEHSNAEVYKTIAELHRELRGQTASEAEILFLDHCKHLALYGIHLFKAIDKDKKPVDIGVGAAGVNIYQDEQKVHSFNWQNIIKIGYKRSYFSVKLKAGTVGKDEKTLYYKLPTHLTSKRAWKCAVEHHTFFRLIQPEDKPNKSFFNFGSQRFRYQGRTQFQTKMASQMFDKPTNVDRAPSAMSQPITSAEEQHRLNTLNLTDSELEQRTFERYRRALTPKSYTRGADDDDASLSATFAKYSSSRPSTLLIVNTNSNTPDRQNQHDLSYSPRGHDDSNLSSAAYYLSERSSLRTPSSAYYPPSEFSSSQIQSPTSPHSFEEQNRGEYYVQMRPSGSGARRNLFGRASASDRTSTNSVRLVSFHEPIDPDQPIPNTYPVNELPEIPIERIVHVYHEGHYDRLSPRREQRQQLPYGFGNYTPRNGVSHVDRLEPHGEMEQQPIRFYVDVRHSGVSRRDPAKRLSHPGKEDIKEQIDPKDYEFASVSSKDPLHRTELSRDVQPANIQQYTRKYHHGDSQKISEQPVAPQYRLITHVQPLVVSHRDSRNGQSSSNVNATISQREQVVSTKVRRESPDADRRVRLSASVDRSGNVTEISDEMATSSDVVTTTTSTSTTVIETAPKRTKKQKIPPTSFSEKLESQTVTSSSTSSTPVQSDRSRFGGFFGKKSAKTSGYPTTSEQYSGEINAIERNNDLENAPFERQTTLPQATTTTITYRLISRIRHDGDEDIVENPNAYAFDSTIYGGDLDEIARGYEIEQSPLEQHSTVYHHGESWRVDKPKSPTHKVNKDVQKKTEALKKAKAVESAEPEEKNIRLIARVRKESEQRPEKEKKPKKESSKFGFFSRTTKTTKTTGYPSASEQFSGELSTTDRTHEFESSPFEKHGIHVHTPHKRNISESSVAIDEPDQPEKKRYRLISRFRHEGNEDIVENPEAYGFASTSYNGPLDEIRIQDELEHHDIAGHSTVYHHGESWRIEKTTSPVGKKVKSLKKETVIVEPLVEAEKRETRLITRVRTEEEQTSGPIKEKKKKESSKSKLPTIGIFNRKTPKSSQYPETTEQFSGELDFTDRTRDLESSPFNHPEYPEYSPKKSDAYQPAKPVSPVEKKIRLIARFRHDGEEDEVEKAHIRPEAYGFASTSYDGPLEETNLERDLEHSKLGDYSSVYHPGESWKIQEKQVTEKKEKAAKKVHQEKHDVRLIARVVSDEGEPEDVKSSVVEKPKSKKRFFKSSSEYPEKTDRYTGELDTIDCSHDLKNVPLVHPEVQIHDTRVISEIDPAVTHEKKRYRLLARFRHEGDEDVVEKPDAYGFDSRLYEGPLDETALGKEVDQTPIGEHSTVYHHGESWRVEAPITQGVKQKKAKTEKTLETVESEKKEVRLIARVQTKPEDEPTAVSGKEKKSKKEKSKSKLPIFNQSRKETNYPEKSEEFIGEIGSINRTDEMDSEPFEHTDYPQYSPKKLVISETSNVPTTEGEKRRYRLIARFRHDGDEDVIEKPDTYEFASTIYDGPLENIQPAGELDQAPIADHSRVYHHGESWRIEKPVSPVPSDHEKTKKVKILKTKKAEEPVEPEAKEIRLIARVKADETEDSVPEKVSKEKKPKTEGSRFGFFTRTTKTTKTSGYPSTSEHFTGELDTTDRIRDLESSPFEHPDYPEYSPTQKVLAEEPQDVPVSHSEKKRYRLIARFRHEGDEDEVEKPDPYAFASTVYDGPLDDIRPKGELDQTPIADHSNVYHHGESWRIEKPVSPVPSDHEKTKKVKTLKTKKAEEPAEPEAKEIRLIARVKADETEDSVPEKVSKEKKPKTEGSRFGFFTRTTKTTKTSGYPSTSEHFTGELDTTDRIHDLESSPFEHPDYPEYAPTQKLTVQKPEEVSVSQPEKKRYRLIARFRHEGDEDEVEKPDAYAFASTVYDGPLDDIRPEGELDQTPIADHSNVYHHGESWRIEKPVSPVPSDHEKTKKVKALKPKKAEEPVEPESKEIRLIARVKADEPENSVSEEVSKDKKPKTEGSRFGFFTRTTKTTNTSEYPSVSEHFIGELDTTDRIHDLESSPFEHPDYPEYSPTQKVLAEEPQDVPVSQPEKKRYRLIARFRHEGDEDEVEKPDAYAFASTVYDGPLDDIHPEGELDQTPIFDHSNVYHHGESWRIEKSVGSPSTLEKKSKKIDTKKEKKDKPVKTTPLVEEEPKEVRLIARVLPQEPIVEETTINGTAEPSAARSEPRNRTPFFKFGRKTPTKNVSAYPETSPAYDGPLEVVSKGEDLEKTEFEREEHPSYFAKNDADQTLQASVPRQEKPRYRLIARYRHEGDEDEVEKPNTYDFASNVFDGPLDDIRPVKELDQAPISDHSAIYHSGDSWRVEKSVPSVSTLEKKIKKVISPKKEKIETPVEPEKHEVRLLARVKVEEPEDVISEKINKKKKPTKKETIGYRETSEQFIGELDTTQRSEDLENVPFEHREVPAYSPKKVGRENTPQESAVLAEKKRYRLIARFRHDGDEDEVEKPEFYGFPPEAYSGILEEISSYPELEQTPIKEHSSVYHHGESWRIQKPASPVSSEEKPKKFKAPKAENFGEPVQPETKEVRLIARVPAYEPEKELTSEPKKEKTPEKPKFKFGFFNKSNKSSGYPSTSQLYTGEVDTTGRSNDLEPIQFEHPEYPTYSPKNVFSAEKTKVSVPEIEKKRYRLVARVRHDGEEDVVEKPNVYSFASTAYEGPLDDIRPVGEVNQTPLADHSTVYHHGESWRVVKPTTPVAPPKKAKIDKKGRAELKRRETPYMGYPLPSGHYVGDLESTVRTPDLDSIPFEYEQPNSPANILAEPVQKRYRLIARFRHEGEEDEVEKPDAYAFASTVYDGPLDDIRPEGELDQSPISDHSNVYHHGESWRIEKPVSPVPSDHEKTKKVKELKKRKIAEPAEPEAKEIRLIARVKVDEPEDTVPEKLTKEKKPKTDGSRFGFFTRTTKTTKTTGYPSTSEVFTGELDTTNRIHDLESSPFEHPGYPEYSPVQKVAVQKSQDVSSVQPEKKRYRLIARFRHEGDEDEVEKPDAYAFASTAYDGPLDDIRPEGELDQTPIADHSTVYHHGESWRIEKPVSPVPSDHEKTKKVKAFKPKKAEEPVEPESKEIRLIARVKADEPEDTVSEKVSKEKKPKTEGSRFGFFTPTKKTTKTSGYPSTSEHFTGELDTTDRIHDLESSPFEHPDYPEYSPTHKVLAEEPHDVPVSQPEKKRYRLIARFRHEGDEDEVEKPDAYAFASTVYDGPLDDIRPKGELDQTPIADHSNVYHHGESWRIEKPVSPVPSDHEKTKKVKALKPKKAEEPVEPESKEIRLIARVKADEPEDTVSEKVSKDKRPKTEGSRFGFFTRTTKTTKTSEYPSTSEHFTGELDTTDRIHDLESSPFELPDHPEYSSKLKVAVEEPKDVPVSQPEKKRYRLIARFRHEGDEDEVEKPEAYAFASTVYDGPLDDIRPEGELDQTPIADHSNVYHHGESWRIEKPVSPVPSDHGKTKKVKALKPKRAEEPVEPESKEIRLIARVKADEPEDTVSEKVSKEKKPKTEGSRFGFFTPTKKTTKTSGYPSTSDHFTGELDTTDRIHDLESSPFEHPDYPEYSPTQKFLAEEPQDVPVSQPGKKRYRLIARFRHEGDEDEVEKPDAYAFASTAYDGPLDDIRPEGELDQTPIADHSNVYHHGESWRTEKPVSPVPAHDEKTKKVKALKPKKAEEPVEPESKKIRLIARVKADETEEDVVPIKSAKPKKEGSKQKFPHVGLFNRNTRTTKASGYPEISEPLTGEFDTTIRSADLESVPFEHPEYPAYSPKKTETGLATDDASIQTEKKRYRLFARLRHDGHEDVVEKPEAYGFPTVVHEGPLDETVRQEELDQSPLTDHATVYHHGDSWITVPFEESNKNKKKAKVVDPDEPEKKDIRLIARVPAKKQEESTEKVAKEKASKTKKFGFLSFPSKKTKTIEYPSSSEPFTGELSTTDRSRDLESSPFEHPEYPAYSPKSLVTVKTEAPVDVSQKKRYKLIARFRHEGDEDVVEKPNAYAFNSTVYDGPLDDIRPEGELDQTPIADHSTVYHHGESWTSEKSSTPVKGDKSNLKSKTKEPVEAETKEVRLIARVRSDEPEDPLVVKVTEEGKPNKESSKFRLFSRSSKSPRPSDTISEPAYDGPLVSTSRSDELEQFPFEQIESTPNADLQTLEQPSEVHREETKRFKWFARFRHEGDEEIVEKPDAYAFASTVYEGPLETVVRGDELNLVPIRDHSSVYHSGESWKQKKTKAPTPEPEEESREIRLVAKIQPLADEEEQETKESPVKERSRLSSFNIFHHRSKPSGFPEPTEVYEGYLNVVERAPEIEKTDLENFEHPEYSLKKDDVEDPHHHHHDSKLYRLIARFRHEGEEDIVEKPSAYAFTTDVYDGPMEEIGKQGEVEQLPIGEHSSYYHHGESWRDKKQKSPKKEKIVEQPVDPEPHEIRLLAHSSPSEESAIKEEKSKKEESSSKFRLRFFSLSSSDKKHPGTPPNYPATSPTYEGPLDVTGRSDDLEKMPYLYGEIPPYSPKYTSPVKTEKTEKTEKSEKPKRTGLFSRFRHEGHEDVVEKPTAYAFASEVYDGPLDETPRHPELDQTPIGEHSSVYHHGESWIKDKPAKTGENKEKDIRLVARVLPQEQDNEVATDSEGKSPRKEDKSFRFRFFSLSKQGKSSGGYPETSTPYEGPLEITTRSPPLEDVFLDVSKDLPPYSPRKTVASESSTQQESEADRAELKRYRLIARLRHEGDEDVIETPDAYNFASTVYEGPYYETTRHPELDQAPISDHSTVYHHGESWRVEKPKKKVPEIAEKDDEQSENIPPKSSRFSFLRVSKPNRTSRATSYPSDSENYTGPLSTTDRRLEMDQIPLDIQTGESKAAYSPQKRDVSPETSRRKYRLITRIRYDGHEDEVEKDKLLPGYYSFKTSEYTGKIDETPLGKEVEEVPLESSASVYHHGYMGPKLRNRNRNRNLNLFGRKVKTSSDKEKENQYTEPQSDVKLIARVLPMKKGPETAPVLSDDEKESTAAEQLQRSSELEPRALTDLVGPSGSRNSHLAIESTINYFPSSLQYDARAARIEGYTNTGDGYVEVRMERRAEVQLEPVYVLRETTRGSHAYLSTASAYFAGATSSSSSSATHSVQPFVGSVTEYESGQLHFSTTPEPPMSPPERPSLLARLGLKRDKNKKNKKGGKKDQNESSGTTSDSEHDEKREFAVVEFEPQVEEKEAPPKGPKKPEHLMHKSPARRADEPMNEVVQLVVTGGEARPAELGATTEVRHETREQQFRLTGDGYTSGFNPNDPSLMATIQRAERLNASSPRLEHAERTFTVRANAPLPVSFEESGQPYTTVSTWQETSDLPEHVEVYTDENGRQITRTIKSSQVKHTVQTQSFQNFIVDGDQVPVGVVDVERSREQLTPLGQQPAPSENGGDTGIVETQTRTMSYEAQGGENAAPPGWAEQGLGEYVSSKSVTQGNRTIETITYKTEKDGVVETHVEHRVTIHSDGDIDHDAELSQAILEATQMNPDMVVEKIEVRQETTQ